MNALTKYQPLSLFDELDLWKPIFGGLPKLSNHATGNHIPPVDIIDNDAEFIVKADMPGLGRDDIQVLVEDGTLTITSQLKTENEVKEENYIRRERACSGFAKSIVLSDNVNEEAISAAYNDGVLTVTLPKNKARDFPKKRNIEIQ